MLRACVLYLFLFCSVAVADTLLLPAPLDQLSLIGQGRLRYFGFHVYDASTWSIDGKPIASIDSVPTPFALQIRYAREIKADDLINKTREAWQDLRLRLSASSEWLTQLRALWPDVKEGDVIVCYVDDDQRASFYVNGKLAGTMDSTSFTSAFLAIWLHEQAEFAELQKQLSGQGSSE